MAVRLIHISDLHFAVHPPARSTWQHSHDHLKGIETFVNGKDYDRLIVSGDLTDTGDSDSMAEARRFLVDEIAHPAGGKIGLRLKNLDKVITIPGNHDAFNASGAALARLDRFQKSTKNFITVFPERPLEAPYRCGYDWIDGNDGSVFIAYVDSCHLGDSRWQNLRRRLRYTATGKMSKEQTDELRDNYYYLGQRGQLTHPNGGKIAKEDFAASLKVLVMHHYVFAPPGVPNEKFMRLHHLRDVLLRLALSDFDVILCGHSHVPHNQQHEYYPSLDRRRRKSFHLTYAANVLGLDDFPRVLGPRDAQYALNDWASFVVRALTKNVIRDGVEEIPAIISTVTERLQTMLGSERQFRESMRELMRNLTDSGEFAIRPKELREAQRAIVAALTPDERRTFARLSKKMPAIFRALKRRPVVQLSCGSSAKMMHPKSRNRSVFVYDVERHQNGWKIEVGEHGWDATAQAFTPNPKQKPAVYLTNTRRPS